MHALAGHNYVCSRVGQATDQRDAPRATSKSICPTFAYSLIVILCWFSELALLWFLVYVCVVVVVHIMLVYHFAVVSHDSFGAL